MILTMLLLAAAGVAVRMEQVAEEKRILDISPSAWATIRKW